MDAGLTAIKAYAARLKREFSTGKSTEHTFRPALKAFLEELQPTIHAVNEPKQVACGAPDFTLQRGSNPIGYVETKDVGEQLGKTEATEQLVRYRYALESLVLTDYLEFRWFLRGKRQDPIRIGRIDGHKIEFDEAAFPKLLALLNQVLTWFPQPIETAQLLAERMANHAHIITGMVGRSFEENNASETLQHLRKALATVLMPGLEDKDRNMEFADLYSQCIVYGLFAARCNHKGGKFLRESAAKEIPKTNPFLQKLFEVLTGTDLDDEPYVGIVEDLVATLDRARIDYILADFGQQGNQDPVLHFYETFLKAYDPELKRIRGVFYTPTPAVDYIVRSVDVLLRSHFDLPQGLADASTRTFLAKEYVDDAGKPLPEGKPREVERVCPRTLILDPSCGTATFLHSVIRFIRQRFIADQNAGLWSSYVSEHLLTRLYGFELLMASYAMAHFKLAMQLAGHDLPTNLQKEFAYDFAAKQRLNVYLTNTLDSPESVFENLFGPFRIITEEARAASRVKRELPIMVILGNPPWSGHSANKGRSATELVRDFQTFDGKPLEEVQQKWLHNDYVKFTSWARRRIEKTGVGILAFVMPNGFLDGRTFRGMRQKLMDTFEDIYVLDLHGAVKRRETATDGSKDENIFDIENGVSIAIMVRTGKGGKRTIHHADIKGLRSEKFDYLDHNDVETTRWQSHEPQRPFLVFKPESDRSAWDSLMGLEDIMPVHSIGITSSRDDLCFQFSAEKMAQVAAQFASLDETAARREFDLPAKAKEGRDWKVATAQQDIRDTKASKAFIRPILYQPYDVRYTYYTGQSRGFISQPQSEVMRHMFDGDNLALGTTKTCEIDRWEHTFCTSLPIQLHTVSNKESNDLFPLKIKEARKGKQARLGGGHEVGEYNLSQAFLNGLQDATGTQFAVKPKKDQFGPDDAFGYLVGILNTPTYRSKNLPFLRTSYPRIPMPADSSIFRAVAEHGLKLAKLQAGLLLPVTGLASYPIKGTDVVQADGVRHEGQRLYVNQTQFLEPVPAETWSYSVGGRAVVQKWLHYRDGVKLSASDLQALRSMLAAIQDTRVIEEALDNLW